ncbi:M3 family metallopeptidase [Nocardioides aurantiacus]|uniref:M3 family metallopeptidase n=1 Tax=Nocardioides aurantiacus TaxID=86796 RepID=UPI00403F8DE9
MDLQPLALPADAAAWLPWTDAQARDGLAAATDGLADLRAAAPGDPVALQHWNDVGIALSGVLSVVSLLGAVHPDAAVRDAAEAHELEARRFATDVYLDATVHARLAALDADALDAPARRVLTDALRAFRRAGVDRDEATRERVRTLDARAQELGQAFSRAIRDGRRTTRVPAAALAGLPEDYLAEHPAAADGLVEVSTDYPDTLPVLTHARDPEVRRQVARTMHDVAWPENDAVLAELLTARRERATLLGYADWPSYDAEVKMIGEGDRIPAFVDRVADAADAPGRRDLDALLTLARAEGEDVVDFSSWRHHLETLRRERFDVDTQEVRRYLDAGKVRAGLLEVTGRLFGLRYEPVDAPTWHPEVTTHDVLLDDGTPLGRIHLDLHPRPNKYNHAAQFSLVPGVRDRQLPEGVLVCNFSRGLMELDHVVTLFHEFGHLLHHVLAGRHDWVRFSGVSTEWDFVEAPSQMLEEWAWDAGVLASFATDADGTPIPAELVGRMRAAQELGTAFLVRTQTAYAAVSYWFHQECPPDLTARLRELMERYSLVAMVPGTHFHTGFGHLEGYTSAYYTYLWSKVIAKDLFSAFDEADLFAPEVARRYRDTVLAAGGSRDATDLVEDFLGRPYDDRAFSAWLDHRGEDHL